MRVIEFCINSIFLSYRRYLYVVCKFPDIVASFALDTLDVDCRPIAKLLSFVCASQNFICVAFLKAQTLCGLTTMEGREGGREGGGGRGVDLE